MTTNTVATNARHASTTRTQRNSSIELLRIIAMLMILSHHFVLHNGSPLSTFPLTPAREIFSFIFLSGGKIGVAIFFSISTWFLISSEQSIKKNFKRIWLMERELLFWSLTLLVVFVCIRRSLLSSSTLLGSFLPTITNLWWYATSYAAFLAILPFLQYALVAMGPKMHAQLTLLLSIVFGILSLLPIRTIYNIYITDVYGFIYLFIIISFYKLYLKKLNTKQLLLILFAGIAIAIVIIIAKDIILLIALPDSPGAYAAAYSPFRNFALPTIMVGLSMFLLFDKFNFYNKPINFIAKSSFAVYLISEYPPMRTWLWSNVFNLKYIYSKPFMPLYAIGILLAVYAACTLCDFIRRGLFAITVDRHPGRWFNALWNTVAHWSWVQSLPKAMLNSSANTTDDLSGTTQLK